MNNIINILEETNSWMKSQQIEGTLTYRSEVSHMVRCGRSQISLNNSEVGQKIYIDLQKGKKKASSSITFQVEKAGELKLIIGALWDKIELMPEVPHVKPLTKIAQGDLNFHKVDSRISHIDSAIMVDLYKSVDEAFLNENIEISGSFSAGEHGYVVINSEVDNAVSYLGSDFNAEVVLQLLDHDKKELRASCVGENLDQYNPQDLINELKGLYKVKTETERIDIEPGEYDVVFAADAFADLTMYMSYLTFYGEGHLFERSMLSKEEQEKGAKIFGDNVSILDDPDHPEILFARKVGLNGVERSQFPLIAEGKIQEVFYSDKDSCDRFGVEVNNDFSVASLFVKPGQGPSTFEEFVKGTKKKTIYIPFIHYMNFTNPAKGEFTGTSRFGTFLIENGEIKNHLYNVRLNDSYKRIFNNIDWLSKQLSHINMSNTYGMRNASSITCPKFVKVHDVKISDTSKT